jgi:hypothetical protein
MRMDSLLPVERASPPEVRKIFSAFKITGVDCHYSIAGGKGKKVKELIISGP